ncbi:GD14644 [Drosophila simulans]|uniref:GD14644 n=1 Tax=Drosophila simulans TaxID=7240 RepID=B4QMU6_DROSI|nr:GD14644 [Drosophila simulans]
MNKQFRALLRLSAAGDETFVASGRNLTSSNRQQQKDPECLLQTLLRVWVVVDVGVLPEEREQDIQARSFEVRQVMFEVFYG